MKRREFDSLALSLYDCYSQDRSAHLQFHLNSLHLSHILLSFPLFPGQASSSRYNPVAGSIPDRRTWTQKGPQPSKFSVTCSRALTSCPPTDAQSLGLPGGSMAFSSERCKSGPPRDRQSGCFPFQISCPWRRTLPGVDFAYSSAPPPSPPSPKQRDRCHISAWLARLREVQIADMCGVLDVHDTHLD